MATEIEGIQEASQEDLLGRYDKKTEPQSLNKDPEEAKNKSKAGFSVDDYLQSEEEFDSFSDVDPEEGGIKDAIIDDDLADPRVPTAIKRNAKHVTAIQDSLLSRLLSALSGEGMQEYRLTDDEKQDFQEAWQDLMVENNWTGFNASQRMLITFGTVYGLEKVPKALKARKRNRQAQENEEIMPFLEVEDGDGNWRKVPNQKFFELNPDILPIINWDIRPNSCKYAYVFEDRMVPIPPGRVFENQTANAKWNAQRGKYLRHALLEWPFD